MPTPLKTEDVYGMAAVAVGAWDLSAQPDRNLGAHISMQAGNPGVSRKNGLGPIFGRTKIKEQRTSGGPVVSQKKALERYSAGPRM